MSNNKLHKTLKEKYNDENYGLFGSDNFKLKIKQKYGVEYITQNEEIKEKIKQTNLEKYGVECNLQLFSGSENSKKIWNEQGNLIKEKIKQTSLNKYGTESPNQSEIVKNKIKITKLEKYGNEYYLNYEKTKQTKLERYGDINYHNKEQMSKTIKDKHIKFETENNCTRYTVLIKKYGQGWKSLNLPILYNGRFRYISNDYINIIEKYFEEQHNLKSVSKQENELYSFIKENTNNRIYKNVLNIIKDNEQNYELDIYIPKLKIAFEYNGNYWHSNIYKDKYYHQKKTKLCYENNIQLIHIYEFDWVNNKDKIKKHIIELLNGNDCSIYNWIPLNKFNEYILTEPEKIEIDNKFIIYNEGKFIKK